MPPLTVAKLRAIKADGKVTRYSDEKGLYLETSAAGGKYWRMKYRFGGREKRLSFGPWPEVSLEKARELRDNARRFLRDGIDPSRAKGREHGARHSFESVAKSWLESRKNTWSKGHLETVVARLEDNVYPDLGVISIDQIEPADVLIMIKKIEARGALEVAKRTLGICSQVFRYAVASALIPSDPCRDLQGALEQRVPDQFAALTTPKAVGELMRRIDEYRGTAVVRAALEFSALTFCRPGEVRHAEWSEIDFEKELWTIPASKMKLTKEMKLRKEPHLVPLARQALDLLQRMRHFTGRGKYVFPNPRNKDLPASENAVNGAVRRMGYAKDEMTAHGFRSTASTLLNELGVRPDIVEAQLAHKSADKIRAIYNRAKYMENRRVMMQQWADYLDKLRAAAIAEFAERLP